MSEEELPKNGALDSHHEVRVPAPSEVRIGRLRIRAVKCNMGVGKRPSKKRRPGVRVKSRINRAVRSGVKVSHPGSSGCCRRRWVMCALTPAEGKCANVFRMNATARR